ncbi:hypothetical protein LPJ75_000580, partial [Coemansia sp. RSA 2598]
ALALYNRGSSCTLPPRELAVLDDLLVKIVKRYSVHEYRDTQLTPAARKRSYAHNWTLTHRDHPQRLEIKMPDMLPNAPPASVPAPAPTAEPQDTTADLPDPIPFADWSKKSATRLHLDQVPAQPLPTPAFPDPCPGLTVFKPTPRESVWTRVHRLNATAQQRGTLHRMLLNRIPKRPPNNSWECHCGADETVHHLFSKCRAFARIRAQFFPAWLRIARSIAATVRQEMADSLAQTDGPQPQPLPELPGPIPSTVRLADWIAAPLLRWSAFTNTGSQTAELFNRSYEIAAATPIHLFWVARNDHAYSGNRWSLNRLTLHYNTELRAHFAATIPSGSDSSKSKRDAFAALIDLIVDPLLAVPVPDAPAPTPTAPAVPATAAPDDPAPPIAAATAPSYSAVASRATKRSNPNEGGSRSVQPRTETRANPSARRGPTKAELEEEWRSNPANVVPTAWLTYPGASPAHLPRIRAQILSALGLPANTPRHLPADPIHCYVFGHAGSVGVVFTKPFYLATIVAKPLTLSGHNVHCTTPDGALHAYAVLGAPPSRERRHVLGALRQFGRVLSAERLDLDSERTSDWHGFIALADGQELPRSFRFKRQRKDTYLVPLSEAEPCPTCCHRLAVCCHCDAPRCHPSLVDSRMAQQIEAARASNAPAPGAEPASHDADATPPTDASPAAREDLVPIPPAHQLPTAPAPSAALSPAAAVTEDPVVTCTRAAPAASVADKDNDVCTPLPAPAKQAAATPTSAKAPARAAPATAHAGSALAVAAPPTNPTPCMLSSNSVAMATDSDDTPYSDREMDASSSGPGSSDESDAMDIPEPKEEMFDEALVSTNLHDHLPRTRSGHRDKATPITIPGKTQRTTSKVTKTLKPKKSDANDLGRSLSRIAHY